MLVFPILTQILLSYCAFSHAQIASFLSSHLILPAGAWCVQLGSLFSFFTFENPSSSYWSFFLLYSYNLFVDLKKNWHTLWWLFWYIYLPNSLVFCIIFHWPSYTTSNEGLWPRTRLPINWLCLSVGKKGAFLSVKYCFLIYKNLGLIM